MKEWYKYLFQASFAILAFQNLLIPLSVLIESMSITSPYYFDVIGFTLLSISLLFYYGSSKNLKGLIASFALLIWVVVRIIIQFVYAPLIDYSKITDTTVIIDQISSNLIWISILLLISSIALLIYGLFQQLSSESNLPILLVYVCTNLFSVLIISWAFLLRSAQPLEVQIQSSSLGFVLKIILVPLLGIFAFTMMFFRVEDIYPEVKTGSN